MTKAELMKENMELRSLSARKGKLILKLQDKGEEKDTHFLYNNQKHTLDEEALTKLRDENVRLKAKGDTENRDHEVVKMKFELCKQIFDLAGMALKLDTE